jgi:hypothetical protein
VAFWLSVVARSPPVCPDDPVAVWIGVSAHQAIDPAGLDRLHEPDVLVAVGLIGRWEPVTETDTRPMLVGEQNHDIGMVSGAGDPHLEVVGDPRDEGLSLAGAAGSGSPGRPPASSRFRYSYSCSLTSHDPVTVPRTRSIRASWSSLKTTGPRAGLTHP